MSNNVQEFIDEIIPGNYWITKSMEFRKINSSGTLWYLKKWIVFYEYLFLNKSFNQDSYKEIVEIFNNFIRSLPENNREEAVKFFFKVDIRKPEKFMSLLTFQSDSISFEDNLQETLVKKFYFSYLMDLGGQSGDNKFVKDQFFCGYSYKRSLDNLELMLEKNNVKGKDKEKRINTVKTDFHAAIRNERKIFFYFGFFHGNDKFKLFGFHCLTAIGKTIIKANFHELLLVWEHQKIKMISQSTNTKIEGLSENSNSNYLDFSINFHPYISLLEIVLGFGKITADGYKYVFSRFDNMTNTSFILKNYDLILNKSKLKVSNFDRKSDKGSEDFGKETKKYFLGISDMPKDKGSNYFSFLNKNFEVNNKEKGRFILDNLKKIRAYLDNKHTSLYIDNEKQLKDQYRSKTSKNFFYQKDIAIEYDWNKYIINLDKNIVYSLIYLSISLRLDSYHYSVKGYQIRDKFLDYQALLSVLNVGDQDSNMFTENILSTQDDFKNGIMFSFPDEEYEYEDPDEITSEVTLDRIIKLAPKLNNNRERNMSIIRELKTHYFQNFMKNNELHCDCCSEPVFKKNEDKPYIEFHHLIPFSSDNGPDHYLNLYGLCSNCHKKMHLLNFNDKPALYKQLSENNNWNVKIQSRIFEMFEQSLLDPIHLEFLRKEGIINDQEFFSLMDSEIAV